MRNKIRECVALQRKLETTCSAHVEEITKRKLQDQVSSPFLCVFLFLLFVVSNFLSYFSKVHEKYQKKLETTNDNEKTQRKEAEMEAGVATALVLGVHGQRQLAEEQLQVRVWVRAQAKDSKTIRDRTQQRAQQDKQPTRHTEVEDKKIKIQKKKGSGRLVYIVFFIAWSQILLPPFLPSSQFYFSPLTTQFSS